MSSLLPRVSVTTVPVLFSTITFTPHPVSAWLWDGARHCPWVSRCPIGKEVSCRPTPGAADRQTWELQLLGVRLL